MQKTKASRKLSPATSQPKSKKIKPKLPARAAMAYTVVRSGSAKDFLDSNLLGEVGDFADLGVHPGAKDQRASATANQRSPGKEILGSSIHRNLPEIKIGWSDL